MDRFAQFFIAPLFTEGATDREINAVDSEHDKNVAIDVWRIRQVSKSLADPNHPYVSICFERIKKRFCQISQICFRANSVRAISRLYMMNH